MAAGNTTWATTSPEILDSRSLAGYLGGTGTGTGIWCFPA